MLSSANTGSDIPKELKLLHDLIKADPDERQRLLATQQHLKQVVSDLGDLMQDETLYPNQLEEVLKAEEHLNQISENHFHFRSIVFGVIAQYPNIYDVKNPNLEKSHLFENIKQLEKYLTVLKWFQTSPWVSQDAHLYGQLAIAYLDTVIQLVHHTGLLSTMKPFNAKHFEAHISYVDQVEYINWGVNVLERVRPVMEKVLGCESQPLAIEDEGIFSRSFTQKLKPYLPVIALAGLKIHMMQSITQVAFNDQKAFDQNLKQFREFLNFIITHAKSICESSDIDVRMFYKELLLKKQRLEEFNHVTMSSSGSDVFLRCVYHVLSKPLDHEASPNSNPPSLKGLLKRIETLENQQKEETVPTLKVFMSDYEMIRSGLSSRCDFKTVFTLMTLARAWSNSLLTLKGSRSCYFELCFEKLYECEVLLSRQLSNSLSMHFIEANTRDSKRLSEVLALKDLSESQLLKWINGEEGEEKKKKPRKKKRLKANKENQSETRKNTTRAPSLDSQSPVKPTSSKMEAITSRLSTLSLTEELEGEETQGRPWQVVGRGGRTRWLSPKKKTQTKRDESSVAEAAKPPLEPNTWPTLSDATSPPMSDKVNEPVEVSEGKHTQTRLPHESPVIPDRRLGQPVPEQAYRLMELLEEQGACCYIYGGYIRDDLHQVPYSDIDLVVDISEEKLNSLLPNCKKLEKVKSSVVYQYNEIISLTLAPNLELKEFSKGRVFCMNALFANKDGILFDPMQVYRLALSSLVLAMPDKNAQEMFSRDPSSMLRLIRYSTHVSKMWDRTLHEALRATLPQLTHQPFGLFLHQFSELFMRGRGLLHFNLLYKIGAFPHICLNSSEPTLESFNEHTTMFHFIAHELGNIDSAERQGTHHSSRLYLLSLCLLPAVELARLRGQGSDPYSEFEMDQTLQKVLDDFFEKYLGELAQVEQTLNFHQMFALLRRVLWPNFLRFKVGVEQQASVFHCERPPSSFYHGFRIEEQLPQSIPQAKTPYFSYVVRGTTYFVQHESDDSAVSSPRLKLGHH